MWRRGKGERSKKKTLLSGRGPLDGNALKLRAKENKKGECGKGERGEQRLQREAETKCERKKRRTGRNIREKTKRDFRDAENVLR